MRILLSRCQERLRRSSSIFFIVHGIGRHDDFLDERAEVSRDGTPGTEGSSHKFRRCLAALLEGRLRHAPLALSVRSVEWHSCVHGEGEGGADALLEACSPDGVLDLRSVTKTLVMDILAFTCPQRARSARRTAQAQHVPSPQLVARPTCHRPLDTFSGTACAPPARRRGSRIIAKVHRTLEAKHAAFLAEHPGWMGSVSLLGHSLGSVILFDLLSQGGSVFQGISFPTLSFHVANVFLFGSPAAAFLIGRKQVVHQAGDGTSPFAAGAEGATTLRCERLFNVVSSADPISYYLAPLVHPSSALSHGLEVRAASPRAQHEESSPPTPRAITPARTLPIGASPGEIAAFIRENEFGDQIDALMPQRRVVSELLNAPRAHSA